MKPRMTFVALLLFAELALAVTAGMLGGELAARIGMLVALTLPLLFLLRAPAGTPPISFAVRDRRAWLYLLLFPPFVLLTAAVSLAVSSLLGALDLPVTGASPMPTLAAAILLDALLPAVSEELFCRGAVFSALRPLGRRNAILGSALLFGLMHASLAQLPYAFVAGILLALLYECSGSLLLPILFHLGNNLLALSLHFGLSTPRFFLIVGIAAVFTLPLFILLAKRRGVPLPPKGEQPPHPLRDLFLSPVLLYLLIILSIILLPAR